MAISVENWTANVVARLHAGKILQRELAAECGFSETYLSLVLNHERGDEGTKQKVLEALERLEAKRVQ